MKELQLEIITPSKTGYTGNIVSVIVPGTKGNFQVLYNHAPIISSLEIGEIRIEWNDKYDEIAEFYDDFLTSKDNFLNIIFQILSSNIICLSVTFEYLLLIY